MHSHSIVHPVEANPVRCTCAVDAKPIVQFAILEVTVDSQAFPHDWTPKNHRAIPPRILGSFPLSDVHAFVNSYNGSEKSKQRGHWLIVSEHGGFFQLSNLDRDTLPDDSTAFPLDAELMGRFEAIATAEERNRAIYQIARNPRVWNVVIRRHAVEAPQATQEAPSVTDKTTNGETVHVATTSKPSGYRIGLRHPQWGVVALSETVFAPRDCESILEESGGCLVAIH